MKPQKPNKVRTFPKVRPLDPDKPPAAYRVPAPSRDNFKHIPGQLAMDFSQDQWDALTEEPD